MATYKSARCRDWKEVEDVVGERRPGFGADEAPERQRWYLDHYCQLHPWSYVGIFTTIMCASWLMTRLVHQPFTKAWSRYLNRTGRNRPRPRRPRKAAEWEATVFKGPTVDFDGSRCCGTACGATWAIIVVVLVIVLLASTGGVNPGASLWLLPREDDGDEDVRSGGGNTTSVFAGQGGNGTFWWLP